MRAKCTGKKEEPHDVETENLATGRICACAVQRSDGRGDGDIPQEQHHERDHLTQREMAPQAFRRRKGVCRQQRRSPYRGLVERRRLQPLHEIREGLRLHCVQELDEGERMRVLLHVSRRRQRRQDGRPEQRLQVDTPEPDVLPVRPHLLVGERQEESGRVDGRRHG